MWYVTTFAVGLMLGAMMGFAIAAILQMSREADRFDEAHPFDGADK